MKFVVLFSNYIALTISLSVLLQKFVVLMIILFPTFIDFGYYKY